MKSGGGRSLNALSVEPRRCWRIYEPGGGAHLSTTRLLLSSAQSISCLGEAGSGMLCSRTALSPTAAPHPGARRGCRRPGRGGEDLTRRVGAELQLAAPLGAAGRAAGPALAGRLQEAEMLTMGLTSSSPAKPSSHPKTTPGCPVTAAQRPCKAAGGADSIRGPQDPLGQDASLTIEAGIFLRGLWTQEKRGHCSLWVEKVSLYPVTMRKA